MVASLARLTQCDCKQRLAGARRGSIDLSHLRRRQVPDQAARSYMRSSSSIRESARSTSDHGRLTFRLDRNHLEPLRELDEIVAFHRRSMEGPSIRLPGRLQVHNDARKPFIRRPAPPHGILGVPAGARLSRCVRFTFSVMGGKDPNRQPRVGRLCDPRSRA